MKIKETITAPILALVIFLLLILSRVIDTEALAGTDNVYLVIVIFQLLIFIIPAIVYCRLKGKGYIKGLRIAPVRAETLPIILVASGLLISGETLLRIALGSSESFSLYGTYTATGTGSFDNAIYLIFAFAIIPAICEEFVFRSIMISEYEKGGIVSAVIASSLLFALMHFNLSRIPIYIFSGIILSMTLYAARSAIATVIVHFIYNMFGLFGQKYMSAFYETTGNEELFIFLVALVFIVLLAVFFGEAGRLYTSYSKKNKSSSYVTSKKAKKGKVIETFLSPTYLACVLLFVIVAILMA